MTFSFLPALRGTAAVLRQRASIALFVVLCAACLHTAAQWSVSMRLQQVIWERTQLDGIDPDHVRSLADRAEAGDGVAMQNMLIYLESGIAAVENLPAQEREAYYSRKEQELLWATAPLLVFSVVLICLVALMTGTFFLVLGILPDASLRTVVWRSAQVFFPLIGVWVWAFVRSLAWIPVLGFVTGLILGPRYAFAALFVARDRVSIREAVRRSSVQTQGRWADITASILVFSLLLIIVVATGQVLLGSADLAVPYLLNIFTGGLIQYAACGVYALFLVQMGAAILPKKGRVRAGKHR